MMVFAPAVTGAPAPLFTCAQPARLSCNDCSNVRLLISDSSANVRSTCDGRHASLLDAVTASLVAPGRRFFLHGATYPQRKLNAAKISRTWVSHEENICHRRFRNFRHQRARNRCRYRSMVDFPLENAGAVLALLRLSRDWHSFHSGELARAARFVRSLRAARIGYARSSISHAPSGGHGPVSLCSQPDVCSGFRLDRRPGVALRKSRLTLLRSPPVDGFSVLRAALCDTVVPQGGCV